MIIDKIWWLRSHVECTSAAIQALTAFKQLYPGHRRKEVEHCIERAALFIEKIQAADGSWLVLLLCLFTFLLITITSSSLIRGNELTRTEMLRQLNTSIVYVCGSLISSLLF